MVIEKVTCLRCGYEWYPHTEEKPRSCANQKCRSIYWDKPRRNNKKSNLTGTYPADRPTDH